MKQKRVLTIIPDLGNDIMYLDDGEALKVRQMVKENYVKAHHQREISYLEKKDVWRTYIGNPRKEITRRKREDLIDYLYQFYKGQERSQSTIRDEFDHLQKYLHDVLNRSDNTSERYRQIFERFFDDEFVTKPIISISASDIAEYFNTVSKRIHPKQRALKDGLYLLANIFDYAVKVDKIITDNPAKSVNLENYYQNCDMNRKDSDEKIFTMAEIEEIKQEIRKRLSTRNYDIFGYAMLFSIETGVRVAEIPPLRWSDITPKGIHIHRQQRMTRIKGNGRSFEELPFTKDERHCPHGGRYFPLTDEIERILNEVKEVQEKFGISSDYIFCDENGDWINKESYSQRLRRMCNRLGYNVTNNHAFRMSLNSNVFIPLGISLTDRARMLGHSVEVNLKNYSHAHTENLNGIKDILNQSFTQRSRSDNGYPENKKIS